MVFFFSFLLSFACHLTSRSPPPTPFFAVWRSSILSCSIFSFSASRSRDQIFFLLQAALSALDSLPGYLKFFIIVARRSLELGSSSSSALFLDFELWSAFKLSLSVDRVNLNTQRSRRLSIRSMALSGKNGQRCNDAKSRRSDDCRVFNGAPDALRSVLQAAQNRNRIRRSAHPQRQSENAAPGSVFLVCLGLVQGWRRSHAARRAPNAGLSILGSIDCPRGARSTSVVQFVDKG